MPRGQNESAAILFLFLLPPLSFVCLTFHQVALSALVSYLLRRTISQIATKTLKALPPAPTGLHRSWKTMTNWTPGIEVSIRLLQEIIFSILSYYVLRVLATVYRDQRTHLLLHDENPIVKWLATAQLYMDLGDVTSKTPLQDIVGHFFGPLDVQAFQKFATAASNFGTTNAVLTGVILVSFLTLARLALRYYIAYVSVDAQYASHLFEKVFPGKEIKHSFRGKPSSASEIRLHFEKHNFQPTRGTKNTRETILGSANKHKNAALRRTVAKIGMDNFVKSMGYLPFQEAMSRREARRGAEGTRAYMDVCDVATYPVDKLKFDLPSGNHIVIHTDSLDHKSDLDLNHALSTDNMSLTYGFNPSDVAGTSDETQYHFDPNGDFVCSQMHADYRQKLVDLQSEEIVSFSCEWRLFPTTPIARAICFVLSAILVSICLDEARARFFLYETPWGTVRSFSSNLFHVPSITFEKVYESVGQLQLGSLKGIYQTVPKLIFSPSVNWLPYTLQLPADAPVPRNLALYTLLFVLLAAIATALTQYELALTVSKVYVQDVGEDREVALIIPVRRYRGLAAWLRLKMFQPHLVGRRAPEVFSVENEQPIVVSHHITPSSTYYSAGYAGSNQSVRFGDDLLDLAHATSTSKTPAYGAGLHRSSTASGFKYSVQSCSLCAKFAQHRASIDKLYPALEARISNEGMSEIDPGDRVPLIDRPDDEDPTRPKQVSAYYFQPPIILDAQFVHAKTRGNSVDMVERRFTIPANKVIDTELSPHLKRCTQEFVKLMVASGGDAVTGLAVPYTDDEYLESRRKASQRLQVERDVQHIGQVTNGVGPDAIRGFPKTEIASDPTKAARGIVNTAPTEQHQGGKIALGVAAFLKKIPCIACCLNPAQIADRVAAICAGQEEIILTDFSAQDSTIEHVKRAIELYLLLECFDVQYHPMIIEWHATDYNNDIKMPGVAAFEQGFGRGSGSPFTTFGNTPLTVLHAYVALRLDNPAWTPEKCFAELGVYSGDDGLTRHGSDSSIKEAAAMMGFIVKSKRSVPKTGWIDFLGRYYCNPWIGDNNSMSDPRRAMSKATNTQQNLELKTPEQVAHEKALCYKATDPHSPYFKTFIEKNLIVDGPEFAVTADTSWTAYIGFESNTQYPSVPGTWMTDLIEHQMPGFDFAALEKWEASDELHCPILWAAPTPSAAEMAANGTVVIYYSDPAENIPAAEFPSAPKKRETKIKNSNDTKALTSELQGDRKANVSAGKKDKSTNAGFYQRHIKDNPKLKKLWKERQDCADETRKKEIGRLINEATKIQH